MRGGTNEPYRISPKRSREPVRQLTAEDILDVELQPRIAEWPLRALKVKGLLSFGDATEFVFGRLNILVGPNGSGKSNLIDCLRVLRNSTLDIQESFRDTGFEDWLHNGLNKQSGTAVIELIASLPGRPGEVRHQIRFGPAFNSQARLEETITRGEPENDSRELYFVGSHRSTASIFGPREGRRRKERKLGTEEYNPLRSILSQIRDIEQYPEITKLAGLYSSFRIYSEWTFGRNSNLREATSAGRSDPMLSESMGDLALALNALERTAAHEKIRILLGELKETYLDYVTRVLFGRVGLELVEAPFDLPVPARRLSDGTLRFLALATILLQTDPPALLCLEEPELGMHPDMIRMVARMIVDASARTQLIVTTHSEQLLSALQDDFDCLFAFDAGLAGSVVTRFSRNDYQSWREEHTLGDLWTSGELGGNRW